MWEGINEFGLGVKLNRSGTGVVADPVGEGGGAGGARRQGWRWANCS